MLSNTAISKRTNNMGSKGFIDKVRAAVKGLRSRTASKVQDFCQMEKKF